MHGRTSSRCCSSARSAGRSSGFYHCGPAPVSLSFSLSPSLATKSAYTAKPDYRPDRKPENDGQERVSMSHLLPLLQRRPLPSIIRFERAEGVASWSP